MIQQIDTGAYRLIETKGQTKILSLENKGDFAWINANDIGEILVSTHQKHTLDSVLSVGEYRLYRVEDEPDVTDLLHLELEIGKGEWQGYLLLTGLPEGDTIRKRIVPTDECITKTSKERR